ncbi:MAG TPA: ferritin [Rikenellaceae bacterium]|jgi:ferritin|nr:ferritin [Rikenellaceae bacterium]
MKINSKVEEVLNKQINAEFWSAHLYLSMSAYFETRALRGFANWMKVQYQEELTHAIKIFDFINSRGGVVKLEAIPEVPVTWNSILLVFEETYYQECKVTEKINHCYEVALSEKDHAAANMLQWFIDEQAEEEESALQIVDQLKLIGEDNGQAIYLLDKELGARVFVDSTKTSA